MYIMYECMWYMYICAYVYTKLLYYFDIFCCDKTLTKMNLMKKGFVWLKCPRQSITEGSQGRNSSRDRGRNQEQRQLTGSVPLTCSACFLIQLRTTCSEVTSLTVGWALLYQPTIMKTPLQTGL